MDNKAVTDVDNSNVSDLGGSEDTTDSEESLYSDLENEAAMEESSDDSDVEEDDGNSDEIDNSDSSDDDQEKTERCSKDTTIDVNRKEGEGVRGHGGQGSPLLKPVCHRKEDDVVLSEDVSGKRKIEELPDKSDEYEYDSSDEEDLRNTIGNIPVEWYNDYPHIGYNLHGRRILKPLTGDQLDEFLEKMDNPNYWRTVMDEQTGQHVVLSQEQLSTIKQLQASKFPQASYDPHEPWVDFFTKDVMIHPATRRPEDKRSFIPSVTERRKVGKLVHAIKMGWIKPREEKSDEPVYYNIWKDDEASNSKRLLHHIAAPKMKLPGHEESYNPPPEYLLTEDEKQAWLEKEPEERKLDFIPQKFESLRHVPAWSKFIKERFDRCLDLYLCPRQMKMRVNVNPEDLLPNLPKPKDLQPFPTTLSVVYTGHTGMVRSVAVEPSGQYIVSGSDDCSVKVWEVRSGRCVRSVSVRGGVKCVSWCPVDTLTLVAAVVDKQVLLLNAGVGDKLVSSGTENVVKCVEPQDSSSSSEDSLADWSAAKDGDEEALQLILTLPYEVTSLTWHSKGDYFATVQAGADRKSVVIHQLSKGRSQAPFSKSKGLVQCVSFHPSKPYLFVATQRYVRVYNLLKQQLTKKLLTNCKWVSSISVHPGGDNLIIGSYDSRLSWFDLDLSTKPYQTLRHHKKAIRQVAYHSKYPLFASASDDGTVIICHGMVYNDLLQNALIVPVKILRGHQIRENIGVLDCIFHPHQPWIFSAAADHNIRLFT